MKVIMKNIQGAYTNDDALRLGLSYIFHFNQPQPLPVRFYGHFGISECPPAPDILINSFEQVREKASETIPRQLHHIVISFPVVFSQPYGSYFYFIDAIARLFAPYYPVAYAYHTANKTTGDIHSHFHLIISTSSTNDAIPPLTDKQLKTYYSSIISLAQDYGLSIEIL